MDQRIDVDLTDMEKKLKCYVDKGRVAGSAEVRKEPMICVKPNVSLIKPLKKKYCVHWQFRRRRLLNAYSETSQQLGRVLNARLMRHGQKPPS